MSSPREAMEAMEALRGKYPGQTCWIVGKGPSLRYLRAEHFGAGPVVAINTAVIKAMDLQLPNALFLLEKDGRLGDFVRLREDVTAIVQDMEGFAENCFRSHARRLSVDPAEMGFEATEMSTRMALRLALEMDCERVMFVCCDSLTSNEFHSLDAQGEVMDGNVGAYKRLRGLILRDVKRIPHGFVTPRPVDEAGLRDEYNRFYEDNPNMWSHAGHDGEVFGAVQEYGPAESLLDIGCGNGHTIEFFHERWPDTSYCGLDVSDRAIRLAMKRAPYGVFLRETLEGARLPEHEMILMVGVIEHIAEPVSGLRALGRAMKENGIAYLEAPNCIAYPTATKVEGFRRIGQGNRQKEWHLYRSSWEGLIEQAGLRIEKSLQGSSVYNEFIWLLRRRV